MRKNKILLIDDDSSLLRVTEYGLKEKGYAVFAFPDPKSALNFLRKDEEIDLVLSDLALPDMDGIAVLKEVKIFAPQTKVIIITAFATVETAVEAMKQGASDYITKPFSQDELILVVKKALKEKFLEEENQKLKFQLQEKHRFQNIVGESSQMRQVFELIAKVSQSNSNVLILGESGTGKELVAKALHYNSPFKEGPFVAVQSAAIPGNLLESELFGYEKGAFSGAFKTKAGMFELADGGSIFLDEIGEMSLETQAKILRVIQEKEFTPVGGTKPIKVQVRIIAATNLDLERQVKDKKFREDLYYRLNVIAINLAPLRERKDDIPPLVEFFLKKYDHPDCKISQEVWNVFDKYSWPGNVRELENIIERALVLKNKKNLTLEDLPAKLTQDTELSGNDFLKEFPETGVRLEELEKSLIQKALQKSQGNQTQAAKLLGLTRATLIYRMEKFNLHL